MAILVHKLDSGLWLRFLLSNPMNSTEPGDIDAYIAAFPPEVQKSLQKIRALIREAAPDAVEAMKRVRGDDGHERDVFCIVHFHPFLPYAQRVEILDE